MKTIKVKGNVGAGYTTQPSGKLEIIQPSEIIFFGKYPNDKEEVMRISKEGFFWHGEKVEDKENIYERFNQWLKDWNY